MTNMSDWLKDQILTCYFRPYRINRNGNRELAPYWGPMGGTTRVYGGLHGPYEHDPQPFTYVLLFSSDPGPGWQPGSSPAPLAEAAVVQTNIPTDVAYRNNYVGRGWDLDGPVHGAGIQVDTMDFNDYPSFTSAITQEFRKGEVRAVNNSDIIFSNLPAATLTHFVVMDGPLHGRVKSNDVVAPSHALWYGPLDNPVNASLGSTVTIPAHAMTVGFSRVGPTFEFVDAYANLIHGKVPAHVTKPGPPAVAFLRSNSGQISLIFSIFDGPEFIESADIEFHGSNGSVLSDHPTWEQTRLGGYTDIGLGKVDAVAGVTYTGRVRVRNAAGTSDWTNAPGTISLVTTHDSSEGYVGASFGEDSGGTVHKAHYPTTAIGTLTIQTQYEILCQFLGLASVTHDPGGARYVGPKPIYFSKAYVSGYPRQFSGREVFPYPHDTDPYLATSEYGALAAQNGTLDLTTSHVDSVDGWRIGTPADVTFYLYLALDPVNHFGSPSLFNYFDGVKMSAYNYKLSRYYPMHADPHNPMYNPNGDYDHIYYAGYNANISGSTFGYADDPVFDHTVTNLVDIPIIGLGNVPPRVAHSWILYSSHPNYPTGGIFTSADSSNYLPNRIAMGLFVTPQVVAKGANGATVPAGALKIKMT